MEDQIKFKLNFINDYISSDNPATGSKFDPNANITTKNICTLMNEIHKRDNILLNRELMRNKITELYNSELADEYIRQLESHELYSHDETNLSPYCTAITLYPLLLNGLKDLGGEASAPKHLSSFAGSFINLVFAVSSQFSGAVATVEFLMYFDHFARKDYGDNYLEMHSDVIKTHLEQIVYSINQPAAARNYQSVFWNISVFDKFFFNQLFGEFIFPDMDRPKWDTVKKLQVFFMEWFNKERTKALLTFPVVTSAMLVTDEGIESKPQDEEFARMIANQLSKGNSFFIYQSNTVDEY